MGSEKPCNAFLYLKKGAIQAIILKFLGSEDDFPSSRGPTPPHTHSCPVTAQSPSRTLCIPGPQHRPGRISLSRRLHLGAFSLHPSRSEHETRKVCTKLPGTIGLLWCFKPRPSAGPGSLSVLLGLAISVQQEPFTAPYCLISASNTVWTYLGKTGRMSRKLNKL